VGEAAVATFKGRVFDNRNTGLDGVLPPTGRQLSRWWRYAGARFRVSALAAICGVGFLVVSLWLFLDQPTWQSATGMGIAFVILMTALLLVGRTVASYEHRTDDPKGHDR
jgi:hypothetical protein